MDALLQASVLAFWGTPAIVLVWWVATQIRSTALAALGIWLAAAAAIGVVVFPCLGGHGCESSVFEVLPIVISLGAFACIIWMLVRATHDQTKET